MEVIFKVNIRSVRQFVFSIVLAKGNTEFSFVSIYNYVVVVGRLIAVALCLYGPSIVLYKALVCGW